ncbi:hypothetical protein HXX76_005330 [Chlamydomonas incerta]|uniref:Uncharacterized protein n=1 Tax=Chlamydomonas incerta TaxID=51695 RepID=A0A835T4P3_CHLIN|nr:hypothetical protein HXX76_005330 [Chlamydomonas incerta]|eukprot:KAG2438789.1 hypothetical protein HXX76_005330 [Chlamydomonas incerta]
MEAHYSHAGRRATPNTTPAPPSGSSPASQSPDAVPTQRMTYASALRVQIQRPGTASHQPTPPPRYSTPAATPLPATQAAAAAQAPQRAAPAVPVAAAAPIPVVDREADEAEARLHEREMGKALQDLDLSMYHLEEMIGNGFAEAAPMLEECRRLVQSARGGPGPSSAAPASLEECRQHLFLVEDALRNMQSEMARQDGAAGGHAQAVPQPPPPPPPRQSAPAPLQQPAGRPPRAPAAAPAPALPPPQQQPRPQQPPAQQPAPQPQPPPPQPQQLPPGFPRPPPRAERAQPQASLPPAAQPPMAREPPRPAASYQPAQQPEQQQTPAQLPRRAHSAPLAPGVGAPAASAGLPECEQQGESDSGSEAPSWAPHAADRRPLQTLSLNQVLTHQRQPSQQPPVSKRMRVSPPTHMHTPAPQASAHSPAPPVWELQAPLQPQAHPHRHQPQQGGPWVQEPSEWCEMLEGPPLQPQPQLIRDGQTVRLGGREYRVFIGAHGAPVFQTQGHAYPPEAAAPQFPHQHWAGGPPAAFGAAPPFGGHHPAAAPYGQAPPADGSAPDHRALGQGWGPESQPPQFVQHPPQPPPPVVAAAGAPPAIQPMSQLEAGTAAEFLRRVCDGARDAVSVPTSTALRVVAANITQCYVDKLVDDRWDAAAPSLTQSESLTHTRDVVKLFISSAARARYEDGGSPPSFKELFSACEQQHKGMLTHLRRLVEQFKHYLGAQQIATLASDLQRYAEDLWKRTQSDLEEARLDFDNLRTVVTAFFSRGDVFDWLMERLRTGHWEGPDILPLALDRARIGVEPWSLPPRALMRTYFLPIYGSCAWLLTNLRSAYQEELAEFRKTDRIARADDDGAEDPARHAGGRRPDGAGRNGRRRRTLPRARGSSSGGAEAASGTAPPAPRA